jgi:hypothetical protein
VFAPNSVANGPWSAARHSDVRAAGVPPSGLYCFLVARMRTLCSLQAGKSGFQHTHAQLSAK